MTAAAPLHDRAVLTIALGPDVYWNMALNLAYSIRRWHSAADLPVTLVTDRADVVPANLPGVEIVRLQPGELGIGFETKLHLDRLATGRQTLFIDADCLVYGSLDSVFARLRGRPVATVGVPISDGEWFGDVAALCRRLGVATLPNFNGGLYYVEPGELATQVYTYARAMVKDYDAIGLIRLRGLPNEELLMASGMAVHGLDAFPDDGTIMADPQVCPGPLRVNVLRGYRRLTNPPPPSPLHWEKNPRTEVSPVIVHFLNDHTRRTPYRTDVCRLRLAAAGVPAGLADLVAGVLVAFPGHTRTFLKGLFRPLYHRLFGAREIPRSERSAI